MLLLCSEPSQMSSTGAHRPMRFVTPALSPLWPVSRSYCSLGKIYRTGFLVSSSISGTFLPHGLGIFYHLASWLKASPLFRVYKRAFLNKKWPYTIKYTASNSKSSPFFSLLQNVSEKAILCFREAFCFFFHGQKHVPLFFTVVFMDHLPQNHLRCLRMPLCSTWVRNSGCCRQDSSIRWRK